MLGATIHNLVTLANWCPRFVQPCIFLDFSQLHGTTLKPITSLQHIYFFYTKYIYKLVHIFQNCNNLEYMYERKCNVYCKPVTVC
jgi:hypothetical protein